MLFNGDKMYGLNHSFYNNFTLGSDRNKVSRSCVPVIRNKDVTFQKNKQKTKTAWYCQKDRLIDQWNQVKSPEINFLILWSINL